MRTHLDYEDVLADIPQQRALLHLFQEDAGELREWSQLLLSAVMQLTQAQTRAAKAAREVAVVLASFKDRRFALDDVDLDMPQLTTRLSSSILETANGLEVLAQQLDNCVRYPVNKAHTELSNLADRAQERHDAVLADFVEAEDRYLKESRKDSAKKLGEVQGELTMARNQYNAEAIDYVTRLNSLQSTRYTLLIEPMLSLLLAFKSFHSMGADSYKGESMQFLQQSQEKMHQIVRSADEQRASSSDALDKLIARLNTDDFDVSPGCSATTKQGYVRMRVKSGLFMNNWERVFVYVQGTTLMHQKPDDLGSSILLTLSECTVEEATEFERRFVFIVSSKDRKVILQANSPRDLLEWINVLRNVSALSPNGSPHHVVEEENVNDFDLTATPIQFDLLCIGQLPDSAADAQAVEGHFEARFLGTVEVPLRTGGEHAVQSSIDKVIVARRVHKIEPPHPLYLLCAERRVLLKESPTGPNLKAFFDFSDIALWMVSRKDEHHLAIITSVRNEDSSSRFSCNVFEVEGGAAAVCNMLSERTAQAFQELQEELRTTGGHGERMKKEEYHSFNPIHDDE